MKTLVVIAFLVLIVALVAGDEVKKCDVQSDCAADECCLKLHKFSAAKCKKRRQEGQFCFLDDRMHEEKYYKHLCPCVEGLECKKQDKGHAKCS
ncbi:U3-aranetoxin-Ce1a-like [Stegodyphus dumicola]|uniref:U3-aranetoxin-Ce1a-like n=1 Tax=Stegodyphus dumicola TaxID=202533 RepID=UPI0015ADBCAD|nr:U3-aranetoxin-Ce1a-like [Stegodyphus dumicola]